MGVALTGHLLAQRHDGFDLAEIDPHGAAITALLHDPGDDVALDPREVTVLCSSSASRSVA